MTTESELRLENRQLQEEKDILLLRQENRVLKREIERLKKGKKPHPTQVSYKPSLAPRIVAWVGFTVVAFTIVAMIVLPPV